MPSENFLRVDFIFFRTKLTRKCVKVIKTAFER